VGLLGWSYPAWSPRATINIAAPQTLKVSKSVERTAAPIFRSTLGSSSLAHLALPRPYRRRSLTRGVTLHRMLCRVSSSCECCNKEKFEKAANHERRRKFRVRNYLHRCLGGSSRSLGEASALRVCNPQHRWHS
jgi:hypothetical protein